MDIVFDIDGTIADAGHRLHFVTTPGRSKDWDSFLADDQLAKDATVVPVWKLMFALVRDNHRILFITGRPERQRAMTEAWMLNKSVLSGVTSRMIRDANDCRLPIYMRADGDRRSSSVVKEEGLMRARADGFDPVMAFEDRKEDAEMWRRNGLLCCHVAEGNF